MEVVDLVKAKKDWNLEMKEAMEKLAFLLPHVVELAQVCVYLGAVEKQGPSAMNHVSFHFCDHYWSHGSHSHHPLDPYQLHLPSFAIRRQKAYVNYSAVTQ
jgi:hypothetical protein